MTNYRHELVAAVGHPIAENPTGVMHDAAFRFCGLDWRYQLFDVPAEDLVETVRALRVLEFRGMNFTLPHKVSVIPILDQVSSEVNLIGAVNTARWTDDTLVGENTDGKGFMRALAEAEVNVDRSNVLILGAGGAARAISVELALHGAKRLVIVNRNADRGLELASLLDGETEAVAAYDEWSRPYVIPREVDIVVNATSIGLWPDESRPEIDYSSLDGVATVCDVIPNPPDTGFLQAAAAHGARTVNGLGMLVHQAGMAFEMWTGQDAPLEVMREALSSALGEA